MYVKNSWSRTTFSIKNNRNTTFCKTLISKKEVNEKTDLFGIHKWCNCPRNEWHTKYKLSNLYCKISFNYFYSWYFLILLNQWIYLSPNRRKKFCRYFFQVCVFSASCFLSNSFSVFTHSIFYFQSFHHTCNELHAFLFFFLCNLSSLCMRLLHQNQSTDHTSHIWFCSDDCINLFVGQIFSFFKHLDSVVVCVYEFLCFYGKVCGVCHGGMVKKW